MDLEPDSRVTLKIFATRDAAELAASQLEANGIACWIMADDCGGLLPNFSLAEGVRLLVSHADLTAACELLDLPAPPAATVPHAPKTLSPSEIAFGQILIGVALGAFIILICEFVTTPSSKTRFQSTPPRARQTHDEYAPDGKRSDRWIYLEGRLVEHRKDRNLDGEWDYWAYFDDNGRVERLEEDNNFDGKSDETWLYKDGDVVSMEKDTDFNGVPDEFCTYRDHIIQQSDMRPNGSKFSTERDIYSNGVLTEIWRGGRQQRRVQGKS